MTIREIAQYGDKNVNSKTIIFVNRIATVDHVEGDNQIPTALSEKELNEVIISSKESS